MKTPLVSIIIPTYNRADLIRETLDSVLAQTYQNWECIILDDGSTDNSSVVIEDYIKKDNRFQYHNRPNNRPKGANACRNVGFEKSKGEFILFFDSDDIFESFCLNDRVSIMCKKPIDLLIRDTGKFINNKKLYSSFNKDPKILNVESYLRMFMRYEIPWTIMGALYRRDILSNNCFDENLDRFQDVSFNIKLLSKNNNLKIFRDNKIDSFYRVEKEKIITAEFLKVLIASLINFNKIHKDLILSDSYNRDFKFYNIHFFNNYFLKNAKEIKRDFLKLVYSYLKENFFTTKEKFLLVAIFIFYITGLNCKKNIGMYSFNKAYNKAFNFSEQ